MAEFDADNVRMWEEQMKNSAAPIGGHADGGKCDCGDDDDDEDKDEKKEKSYMGCDVDAWEKKRAMIGSMVEAKPVEIDPLPTVIVPTVGSYMDGDVVAWEETMAKIGARPEPSAPPLPSQEIESPETKAVGYMQDDVDVWTKTKTAL